MEELLKAMEANWEGYEKIRQLMINAPKYGNDDDYSDQIAAEVHERTAAAMEESKNRFGVSVRGDGSGISATYSAGAIVPATPDGRKAGEPLADATLSPVFGVDHDGPTGVLKSASKISTEKSYLPNIWNGTTTLVIQGPLVAICAISSVPGTWFLAACCSLGLPRRLEFGIVGSGGRIRSA